MSRLDLTGEKFGRLTVVSFDSINKNGTPVWNCLCECGNKSKVTRSHLRSGSTKSCGCLARELSAKRQLKDFSGRKFGRLTVINRHSNSSANKSMWLCKCDCGATSIVSGSNLISGSTKSCGCIVKGRKISHGLGRSHVYIIWRNMLHRCYNINNKSYETYGKRGIKVCDEWKNSVEVFNEWFEINYKEGLQIDRIDSDGDYTPSNCRFVTPSINSANRGIKSTNTSGYTGVGKRAKKFFAYIKFNSETIFYKGRFTTAEEAAKARDEFIIVNNLPHRVNFPLPKLL